MREITNCQGIYRTPWCDMLFGGCCCMNRNVLHLWYKLEWLQKEIEKRSSYLGKFRRTEEAKHLLDLISMTKDEEDLFYPFAKASMADIADALQRYMPKERQAYLWREGRETKTIESVPIIEMKDDIAMVQNIYMRNLDTDKEYALSRSVENDFLLESEDYNQNTDRYMYAWKNNGSVYYTMSELPKVGDMVFTEEEVQTAYAVSSGLSRFDFLTEHHNGDWFVNVREQDIQVSPTQITIIQSFFAKDIDATKVELYALVHFQYTVGYTIKETNTLITEIRETEQVCKCECKDNGECEAKIVYNPNLEKEGNETSAEYVVDVINSSIVGINAYWLNPIEITDGDYVEWNGELYRAISNGNANYPLECLVKTNDYRESIHYLIGFPKDKSLNMVEALDTAVFEALVARIIFKWLQYSYPEEAERYNMEFSEEMEKIRHRCIILFGGQIVNRIPRLL